MPESQANKENKIKSLIKPNQPEVVSPKNIQKVDLNIAPQTADVTTQNSDMPEFDNVATEMPSFEEASATMPSFEEAQGAAMPSFEDVDNRAGTLDKLREMYDILDTPAEALKSGLLSTVDKVAERLPWPEANKQSVAANFLISTPRMLADTAAEFTGEAIAPESLAMMGGGRLISAVAKTPVAAKYMKPAVATTLDFFSEKIPTSWKKAFEYDLEKLVPQQVVGAMQSAKDKLGKFFIYKYGLDKKQEYVERAAERLRNIKDWSRKATDTGMLLHEGMTPEAQEYAFDMMTAGYSKEYMKMMAKTHATVMKGMGIQDPKKFVKDVIKARDMVDQTSDVFIKEGLKSGFLNQDVANVIQGNKGKYLPRLYEVFENKHLQKEIQEGRMALNDALGLVEEIPDYLKRVGRYTDDEVAAFYRLSPAKQDKVLDAMGRPTFDKKVGQKPLSGMLNFVRKRNKNLSEDVRIVYKEIKTGAYPTAKAVVKMRESVETLKMFDDIAKNKSWATKVSKRNAPTDWVLMPNEKKMGALAGHYVHPAIAEDIVGYWRTPSVIDNLYSGYRKGLGWWKFGKVILNPATHARNMIANSIMMDLSGVPLYKHPKLLASATREIVKKGKYYKEAVKHNLIGIDWAASEIEAFLDDATRTITPSRSIVKKMAEPVVKVRQKLASVYSKEEELFKVAKYIHGREMGLSAKEAAYEAEKWLFNYNKISTATKVLRDNPVYNLPFITYTAKALPRMIETALTNPFRIYKYKLMIDSANTVAARKIGLDAKDLETIERHRGIGILAPVRDSDGNPMFVSLMNILPFADLMDIYNKKEYGDDVELRAIQPGGPANAFWEQVNNRQTWNGQPVVAPGEIKPGWLVRTAHAYKSLMPPLAPPIPFAHREGVQSAGVQMQRLADSAYASNPLGIFSTEVGKGLAQYLVAKKTDYFGKQKHLPFAVIDSILGIRPEPISPQMLRNMENLDIEKGLEELVSAYEKVRADKGLRTEEWMIDIAREQFREKLEELKHKRIDAKERLEELAKAHLSSPISK